MLLRTFILSLATLMAPLANAATVFSDNFDSNALGTNTTPSGWTVSSGTVDVIGQTNFFDFIPGNGRYIDLDGSTKDAGVLSKSLFLTSGVQYLASFQLAGSHRSSTESVNVSFGTSSMAILNIAANAGLTTYSLLFSPTTSGMYSLSFANNSNDNVGALLDNVSVVSTPIPGAIWLFGSSIVGLVAARRKKSS